MVKTSQWLSEGWEMTKENLGILILMGLLVSLIGSATGGILQGPLMVGFFYAIFKKMREPDQPVDVNDLWKGFEYFLPALLASLVSGVFISIGMIACFVGAFFVAALYLFIYPLILEKNLDFWEAMETSRKAVQPHIGAFTGFVFVLALIQFVGALLFGLGVLVTTPIIVCAIACAYRDVFGLEGVQAAEAPEVQAPPGSESEG